MLVKEQKDSGRSSASESPLPDSLGASIDKAGIKNTGYLAKKGTPSGLDARFNYLPPGIDHSNQHDADIREQPYKEVRLSKSGLLDYDGNNGADESAPKKTSLE